MKRSRYEKFCARKFDLQQRVPPHPGSEYEDALAALVNARYYAGERNFRWLLLANRQLRIAARGLVAIDGIGLRQRARVPVRALVRPIMQQVAFAAAGFALVMSAFLLGLHYGPAVAPASPSHYASNTNVTDPNVTVGNTVRVSNVSECGVDETCGFANNDNVQIATTGDASINVSNIP